MKNDKGNNWEARLSRLEEDVRHIKSKLDEGSPKPGWQAMVGSLGGDPIFEEIHRITMELIEKDREKDKRRMRRGAARAKK
ncbi:MAG: hypothetical protein L0Y71_04410 [Gemmataceae bacterium]|nr:hypothetical protein [Gemmataceae bacterium]